MGYQILCNSGQEPEHVAGYLANILFSLAGYAAAGGVPEVFLLLDFLYTDAIMASRQAN
jgi:hypothetical protein